MSARRLATSTTCSAAAGRARLIVCGGKVAPGCSALGRKRNRSRCGVPIRSWNGTATLRAHARHGHNNYEELMLPADMLGDPKGSAREWRSIGACRPAGASRGGTINVAIAPRLTNDFNLAIRNAPANRARRLAHLRSPSPRYETATGLHEA